MADEWLEQGLAMVASERHLRVLRDLLGRDYLARADWGYALRDLAQMAKSAVEAHVAMIALWNGATGLWTAVTDAGASLTDREISDHGSRSVLDRARKTESPVISAVDVQADLGSDSVRRHRVESILVVPLYWWDVTVERPERQFEGCLYAHRNASQPSFTQQDTEIGVDIARLAQPILNLLRYLRDVQTDLAASREELERLRRQTAQEYHFGPYATRDAWFARNVLEPLSRVRHAEKVNILILGPTGSGKTTLAEAYHRECPRASGPFIVLDCSQVTSAETLSAELFGYAPDSGYANAPRGGRPGKAQLAHRGTLFIDEIACMPAELQQKLLRLIDRGTYTPLGSGEERTADLQVIAATNAELAELVRQGRFREDLYWRISDVTLRLPPLGERTADLPELARDFLRRACERCGRKDLQGFTDAALRRLMRHDWSRAGNIRGLERTLLRSVLLSPPGLRELDEQHVELQQPVEAAETAGATGAAPPAGAAHLPGAAAPPGGVSVHVGTSTPAGASVAAGPAPAAAARAAASLELAEIKQAIRKHGGASAAARALGLSYRQLTWQLHKVGLSVRDVFAEPG